MIAFGASYSGQIKQCVPSPRRGRRYYRPPYGSTSARVRNVAAGLGMREVLWTIDTRDWQRPGASSIANSVLSGVRDNSVVLFHDGGGNRSQTLEALQTILPELRRRGFQTGVISS